MNDVYFFFYKVVYTTCFIKETQVYLAYTPEPVGKQKTQILKQLIITLTINRPSLKHNTQQTDIIYQYLA